MAIGAPTSIHDGGTELTAPVEGGGEDGGRVGEPGEVDGGDGVGALDEEQAVFSEGLEVGEVVSEVQLEGG